MGQYSREWWKAHLPDIQAFVDGKDVEVLHFHSRKWMSTKNPKFDSPPDLYRIKPATRTINGFEVPAPVKGDIELSRQVFLVKIHKYDLYEVVRWIGGNLGHEQKKRGLIFLTSSDAIANAKAMLGIDPKEKE